MKQTIQNYTQLYKANRNFTQLFKTLQDFCETTASILQRTSPQRTNLQRTNPQRWLGGDKIYTFSQNLTNLYSTSQNYQINETLINFTKICKNAKLYKNKVRQHTKQQFTKPYKTLHNFFFKKIKHQLYTIVQKKNLHNFTQFYTTKLYKTLHISTILYTTLHNKTLQNSTTFNNFLKQLSHKFTNHTKLYKSFTQLYTILLKKNSTQQYNTFTQFY